MAVQHPKYIHTATRLANRLSFHRERLGFTQAEMAVRCELERTRYAALERVPREDDQAENPTLKTLDTIARRLAITIAELVDP